jgi:hypothetical protein
MDLHAVIGLLLKTLEVLAEVSAVGSFAIDMAALNQGAPKRDSRANGRNGRGRGRKGPRKRKGRVAPRPHRAARLA